MTASPNAVHPPALGISGMHRSGTSLTASIVAAAGIHLGDELMAAGSGNPRGHFEDLAFYQLHQRILAANGLSLEGFTCHETIVVPPAARAEATELIGRRRANARPWGWKDPRTVLMLDFWAELLPEARWLFVVRPPENVVDSLFRRGDTAFIVNPQHAIDVWVAYNRRILEFVHRNRNRAAVVDLEEVVADPAGLVATVANLLGTVLTPPPPLFEAGLLGSVLPPHRAGLVRTVQPEAHDLHAHLRRLAGLETAPAGAPLKHGETAAIALAEWTISCRTGAATGDLTAREAAARRTAERLGAELETEQSVHADLARHADVLAAERAALATALETEQSVHADLARHADALAAERAALATALETEQAAHTHARARALDLERDVARCEQAIATLVERCDTAAATLKAQAAAWEQTETSRILLEQHLAAAQAQLREAEQNTAQLEAVRAEHDLTIPRLEAALDLARTRAEQRGIEATHAAGERHDLVAQMEAERAIHEALRQDMTGRIAAAVAGRSRARSPA